MLDVVGLTSQLTTLFNQMQSQSATDSPMNNEIFAQELAMIIDTYTRSAQVMIDTFVATTPTGGPVSGTATGKLL